MGGIIEARHPLVLEPVLLDLSSETEALEDDEELAWALSKKVALSAAAVPGSFVPPRFLQQQQQQQQHHETGRVVCLVFPRREVKSSEWLHRIQRQVCDYARQHLVPTQTHFLALDKATSPDPAAREPEARRFYEMARRLPPGSLILGEEAALDVLVEWTGWLNRLPATGAAADGTAIDGGGGPNHDVSTFNMVRVRVHVQAVALALHLSRSLLLIHPSSLTPTPQALINYLFKSPSDVLAGPRVLASLTGQSSILVAYNTPLALNTARAKQAAEYRGQRVTAVLEKLFAERAKAKGDPALLPRIEAGALKDHVGRLSTYTLLVLHSGAHAVDDDAVLEVLAAASDAGVPVITPGLLRAWFRSPTSVAAALKPWPPAFSFLGGSSEQQDAAAVAAAMACEVKTSAAKAESDGGADGGVWEFGYRKRKANSCSDCKSWACGKCVLHQQEYGRRMGKQHQREIGEEWRELF